MNEWLVGVSKYDGVNKDRREVHRIWKRVQAYFNLGFNGRRQKLERRKPELKDNGDHVARMGLSFALSTTAKTAGACVDAVDLRQTIIDTLDRAADSVGGYFALLGKQCKATFRFRNEVGVPFSRETSRASILAAIDQLEDVTAGYV